MNLVPVNGHIIIEPVAHEEFMASERNTYEEVGVVVAYAKGINTVSSGGLLSRVISVGDKVYFDSWLAAKYPKTGGKADEFYWLVKWEDVRAVEYADSGQLDPAKVESQWDKAANYAEQKISE